MTVLALIILAVKVVIDLVSAVFWGIGQIFAWLFAHLWQIAVVAALFVGFVWLMVKVKSLVNRSREKRLAPALHHIRTFVARDLAATGDLKELHASLRAKGISISRAALRRGVQQERESQLEERRQAKLKQAAPDIQAFVAVCLDQATEPAMPVIPTEDLRALQTLLSDAGIELSFTDVQQAVHLEREAQWERRRARALELAAPDIAALVASCLPADRWPPLPALPDDEINVLYDTLNDRRIRMSRSDLERAVETELNREVDARIAATFQHCHNGNLQQWAKTYVDTFAGNDQYLPYVVRLRRKAGQNTSENELRQAVTAARETHAHTLRVQAVSEAIARQRE